MWEDVMCFTMNFYRFPMDVGGFVVHEIRIYFQQKQRITGFIQEGHVSLKETDNCQERVVIPDSCETPSFVLICSSNVGTTWVYPHLFDK